MYDLDLGVGKIACLRGTRIKMFYHKPEFKVNVTNVKNIFILVANLSLRFAQFNSYCNIIRLII